MRPLHEFPRELPESAFRTLDYNLIILDYSLPVLVIVVDSGHETLQQLFQALSSTSMALVRLFMCSIVLIIWSIPWIEIFFIFPRGLGLVCPYLAIAMPLAVLMECTTIDAPQVEIT